MQTLLKEATVRFEVALMCGGEGLHADAGVDRHAILRR